MNDQYKIGIILTLIATLVISLIVYVYIQEETNNLNPEQPTPTPTINPTPTPTLSNTPTPTPDQNEKPIYDVKIIKFEWTSDWALGPVPGDWRFRHFNTTIKNFGNNDVDGLTVEVKIIVNNSELQTATGILYETLDGVLFVGESRELIGRVNIKLDILEQASGEWSNKIIVMLDDSVLDELAIP